MKPVLVTTKHRGVFFGLLKEDNAPTSVKLQKCRNILYWTEEMQGFLGLAKYGPCDGCNIGPAVNATIYDITSISEVGRDAAKKFEEFVWKESQ